MKTDEFVDMLAAGTGPVADDAAARRFAIAVVVGAVSAGLLMDFLLGVRRDIVHAVSMPMFWVKGAYVLSFAAASIYAVSRLARPGTQLTGVGLAVALPVALIWIYAVVVLARAAPHEREILFLGTTWAKCPLLIALLSVPSFVAMFWAARGLAPTRLRLAGATAGLAAGAIGASVYCLHCTEMGAPFLASWYLLGMLIPTAIGALLGPRILRW
jgi:hypothetical protein